MVTDSVTPCSCGVERKFVVLKTSHGEDDLLADCNTFFMYNIYFNLYNFSYRNEMIHCSLLIDKNYVSYQF